MKKIFAFITILLVSVVWLTKPFAAPASNEPIVAAGEANAKISGNVTDENGKPVKDAYVYIYKSTARGEIGPSDFISSQTNENGEFTLNLPQNEYFIIARKRADGGNVGVLSTGDYSSPTGFKVTATSKEESKVTIKMTKIVEPMFFKKTGAEITKSGVKGRILDEKGNPVAGAFAIAYKEPDIKKLPDFASVPTMSDGSYTLYLPEGGKYYVAARITIKKPPEKDELYGSYKGTDDHSVVVKGETFTEGIDVTLKPFAGTATSEFKGFK